MNKSKNSKKPPKLTKTQEMELNINQENKNLEESKREFAESAKSNHYVYVSKNGTHSQYKFSWKSKSFLWKILIFVAILIVIIIIAVFVGLYFAKTYK